MCFDISKILKYVWEEIWGDCCPLPPSPSPASAKVPSGGNNMENICFVLLYYLYVETGTNKLRRLETN